MVIHANDRIVRYTHVMTEDTTQKHRPTRRRAVRILIWIVSVMLTVVVGVAAALTLSPWPGAMLVRALFSYGG